MNKNLTTISSDNSNMIPTKKPRRNLAALETGDTPKNHPHQESSNEANKNVSYKRNLNILEDEYINIDNTQAIRKSSRLSNLEKNNTVYENNTPINIPPPVTRRAPRNLDKLEEDIVFSIKEKEAKMAQKNENFSNDRRRGNRYDNRSSDRVYNRPIEEKKEETKINILDNELFPTLQGAGTDNLIKKTKLSVWNITNHNITTVKPKLEVNKTQSLNDKQKLPIPIPVQNSDFKVNNYVSNEDDSYDSDEYMEEIRETNCDDNYINDDSYDSDEQLYDLIDKENELTNNLEFVKRTHDPRNNFHLKYISQLERELATTEDEIHRHKCLENDLEKIYGPKHIPYKSLYDLEVEKRQAEEEKIKSEKSINKFLLDLDKLK